MKTTATSRRNVDVERLAYRPSTPHPYDLEIFRVSDLKRRTQAVAMRWTYSYEFYMIIFVTEGRCVQSVDFEPVSCSEGAVLVIRPGQTHNFGNDEDWDGWIILLRPEFLLPTGFNNQQQRFLLDLERLPQRLTLNRDERKRASDAILQMRDDSATDTSLPSRGPVSRNAASAAPLSADIHALLRFQFYAFATWLAVIQGRDLCLAPQRSVALQRFDRFQKLVDRHFSEWKQLGDYAKQLACTEKSLTRASTAAVGMSAKMFLSRRITIEAKRLLAHTDLQIGAIAETLGFQEATHFSKWFKRESGCTPREFRLQIFPCFTKPSRSLS